jgi:lipid-binding SYLF domain-containing protein
MKTKVPTIALAALFVAAVCISPFTAGADDDLRNESAQARLNFLKADPGLQRFFDESAGYAMFPGVGKGGFIVGGARGKGVVYQKTNIVGEATMTQASIGAQAGGQVFAEVIFFETPEALKDFKGGKFEMSAEVSAVAAAEGASRAAKYKNRVAVFTLANKGLMVQASIGGQKFKFIPAE